MPMRRESTRKFEDWACGEPLTTQHLVMDFTPSEEIDTDFVQNKCCSFWDFVSKSHKLRDLMAMPELIQYNRPDLVSSMLPESCSSESSTSSEPISCERTALSVLELAEEKGVINDTFVPRLPPTGTCSLGPREYLENEPAVADTYNALSKNKACHCVLTCKICKNRQLKGNIPTSTSEVTHLCKTMRDWDSDHPKSMEPPGRVPYSHNCVMRRNFS